MITVSNDNEIKKLYTNGFCFKGVIKIVKKYWEARPQLVCMKCYIIKYEWLGNYSNKPEKCLLFARLYQTSNHQCDIDKYSKKPGKLCMHIVAQYANWYR